jgi:hypothetical protein
VIKIGMKYLSRDPQISMQSHPEIQPRLAEIANRLAGENLRYTNKQVTYGHIINGLILLLLDNSEEGRLALARHAVERLEDWTVERDPPRSQGLQTKGHPLIQLPKSEGEKKRRINGGAQK